MSVLLLQGVSIIARYWPMVYATGILKGHQTIVWQVFERRNRVLTPLIG
ncbi:hypothetical protein LVY72_13950 [Arthrobacter sp. I2-34]|uniref:Uncharacterized protein n=1 Tax=Arthrobacter hankyongi TaxID=2904801 RepID=A0ABS9L8S1_9MICC|nr:hypothetical protein [Arthrobacter hankyongi]MCG2623001.1 hypothetical protein [Arthrobacter hankyongi]